jgi:hypothetical protein
LNIFVFTLGIPKWLFTWDSKPFYLEMGIMNMHWHPSGGTEQ